MRYEDFNAEKFVANATEFAMLDDAAQAVFAVYHAERVFYSLPSNKYLDYGMVDEK